MTWTQRNYPALVSLCLLAACGGRTPADAGTDIADAGTTDAGTTDAGTTDAGTDTSDAGTGTADAGNVPSGPSAMTFSPNTLAGTYGSGDSISLSVRATLTTPLSGDVYLSVVDGAEVLERDLYIQPSSGEPGTYSASASMSSRLPVGRHQGALEVWLCRDKDCREQHPGSPAYLPYDLQVIQGTNLTPLTRWPSIPDWETYQGNAAHTGYVPVTLDPSRFSPRWSWKPPESYIALSPPVIANGLVYVANSISWPADSPRTLYALRESDKETEWLFNFGDTVTVNPPAVSGGKVFVATTAGVDAAMWFLDAATGMPLSRTAFGSSSYQYYEYYAPTIEGGVVYSGCSNAPGMCAFNSADGAKNWSTKLSSYDDWTPAVDATYAYSYIEGVLSALDKSTGQVAFTIADPSSGGGGLRTYGAPVLGTAGAVIAVSGGNIFQNNRLVSFNTATRSLNWSVTGSYGGAPVLAKGVVYATNVPGYQPRLEARRESTGTLLWSWTPPEGDLARNGPYGGYSDLLVTDNLIFISTNKRVYALDLATHAPVWSYWKTGNLAISANGVLYIDSGGTIGAVNLR